MNKAEAIVDDVLRVLIEQWGFDQLSVEADPARESDVQAVRDSLIQCVAKHLDEPNDNLS